MFENDTVVVCARPRAGRPSSCADRTLAATLTVSVTGIFTSVKSPEFLNTTSMTRSERDVDGGLRRRRERLRHAALDGVRADEIAAVDAASPGRGRSTECETRVDTSNEWALTMSGFVTICDAGTITPLTPWPLRVSRRRQLEELLPDDVARAEKLRVLASAGGDDRRWTSSLRVASVLARPGGRSRAAGTSRAPAVRAWSGPAGRAAARRRSPAAAAATSARDPPGSSAIVRPGVPSAFANSLPTRRGALRERLHRVDVRGVLVVRALALQEPIQNTKPTTIAIPSATRPASRGEHGPVRAAGSAAAGRRSAAGGAPALPGGRLAVSGSSKNSSSLSSSKVLTRRSQA